MLKAEKELIAAVANSNRCKVVFVIGEDEWRTLPEEKCQEDVVITRFLETIRSAARDLGETSPPTK